MRRGSNRAKSTGALLLSSGAQPAQPGGVEMVHRVTPRCESQVAHHHYLPTYLLSHGRHLKAVGALLFSSIWCRWQNATETVAMLYCTAGNRTLPCSRDAAFQLASCYGPHGVRIRSFILGTASHGSSQGASATVFPNLTHSLTLSDCTNLTSTHDCDDGRGVQREVLR